MARTITIFVNRTRAFVRRDCQVATSYKFQFIFQLVSGFFLLFTFYFISRLINAGAAEQALQQYHSDYFSFVLVGIAATGFLQTGISGFAESLRSAMSEGSLEMMFATPTRPIWILAMPCLWSFTFEGLKAAIIVSVGVVLFDADLSRANVATSLLAMVLTMASYSVIGLLSAAIIMIVKRGDPINWAFAHASSLFAGAYFPTEVLPSWCQKLGALLPMTYSYRALRAGLLSGASIAAIWRDLAVLLGFSVVGMPVVYWLCNLAVAKAKKDGSLGSF